MMSSYVPVLILAFSLAACAADKEYDFREGNVDRADSLSDGSFGISFGDMDTVIGLPLQGCDDGSLCNLDLDFGLGDFPQPTTEEQELSRYGIELSSTFTDFNGVETQSVEDFSMSDIFGGGLTSIQRSAPSQAGGDWDIRFRPTFSGSVFDGSFRLSGFRFKATLPLCGGLPCR